MTGKNKWLYKPICKWGMVILAFALSACAVYHTVELLDTVSYDALKNNPPTYEDSSVCLNDMEKAASDIAYDMEVRQTLLVDGKLDTKKEVDVLAYSNGEASKIVYPIETLIKISQSNGDEHAIVVCDKGDGTYYYYTLNDFKEALNDGDLVVEDEEPYDVMSYLSEDGSGVYDTIVKDKNGKIQYIEFHRLDYALLNEANTIDGKNLVDIVNENPELNGDFVYLIETIGNVADDINALMYSYENEVGNAYDNSNLTWVFVDKETGVITSNQDAYNGQKDYEKIYEELKSNSNYKIEKMNNGTYHLSSRLNNNSELLLALDTTYPVKDSFTTSKQNYEASIKTARRTLILAICEFVLFIVDMILITYVAGRKEEDDEIHLNFFDRWKTELAACVVIFPWLSSLAAFTDFETSQVMAWTLYTLIACAFFLVGYTSLVRRIKAKTVWSNSLLYMLIHWLMDIWKHRSIVSRTVILIIGCFFLYFLSLVSSFFFIPAIILYGFVVYYVLKKTINQSKIRAGLKEMSQGNMDVEIPMAKMDADDILMIKDIQNVKEGMKVAVDKSVQSERMKTELIANVSHDIKTPLTSIINYVDLLKREEIDNPKVQEYLDVLDKKAHRLKTLTEDVVEASKVSSGNISLEFMNLNLNEIMNQTIGEFKEKFEEKHLQLVDSIVPYPITISADGRRVWRILENIFNNSLKYSMPNTRVYVELKEVNGQATICMKNISEQPLNISAEELTERFIRGDESRSTEGSGLGLSIAKSLTELQHGTFDIQLDGDLFKVYIQFPVKRG